MEPVAKLSAQGLLFSRVFIGDNNRVWILAEEEGIDSPHTKFLQYRDGNWIFRRMSWGSAGLCGITVPETDFFAVGVDGEVLHGTRTGFSEESVDDTDSGPRKRGYLRDVRLIGERIYVVGMGRQAYRREQTGKWSRFDGGLLAQSNELAGLNAIDGVIEKNIYAVGLHGEIWHHNGEKWNRFDSPTNLSLHRVLCVSPVRTYICGAGGILICGESGNFNVIEQNSTDDNLYDLAWFQNQLYVAGLKNLFVLIDNELQEVALGLGNGFTFGHLHAKDGMLWSVGARHLAYTVDGVSWLQVFYSENSG